MGKKKGEGRDFVGKPGERYYLEVPGLNGRIMLR